MSGMCSHASIPGICFGGAITFITDSCLVLQIFVVLTIIVLFLRQLNRTVL
jgi:hypothetical protein